jgi:pantetheine-phosphate adenylyltransferase
MQRTCVYPGSFDPVTNGHVDIISRAAKIFPEVVVAILINPAKAGKFTVEKRMELIRRACAHLPNVRVDHFDGLLVDYMHKTGANVVVRGLRAVSDFENEFQMAQVNHQMAPDVETLFMMTSPECAYLSSSVVREIARFGGDISAFVPASILEDVQAALSDKQD